MDRRELLAGVAATTLMGFETTAAANVFLELKLWRLHNSAENQTARLAEYLEAGLTPALARAGAKLIGAFANVIGSGGPYYVTLAQYGSLGALQSALEKLSLDEAHQSEWQKLAAGPGLPFVRVESSLLRAFDGLPQPAIPESDPKRPPHIFEWRTYESQSFPALARKIGMFNGGEMQIFQRLEMRPVFFGETIAGPAQPNLMYLLCFDDLAARDRLWRAFGADSEWKKISSPPQLKDSEIVANISNAILRPLPFSMIR